MVVTRYDSYKDQVVYTLRKYGNYMISHIFSSELREYMRDHDIPYTPGNMTIPLTGKDYPKRISLYDHLMLRLQGKI